MERNGGIYSQTSFPHRSLCRCGAGTQKGQKRPSSKLWELVGRLSLKGLFTRNSKREKGRNRVWASSNTSDKEEKTRINTNSAEWEPTGGEWGNNSVFKQGHQGEESKRGNLDPVPLDQGKNGGWKRMERRRCKEKDKLGGLVASRMKDQKGTAPQLVRGGERMGKKNRGNLTVCTPNNFWTGRRKNITSGGKRGEE